MNGWGVLIVACIVLAAAQAVAKVLALAIGLAVVLGVCIRPRQTLSLVALLASIHIIEVQPVAFVIAAACLSGALALCSRRR